MKLAVALAGAAAAAPALLAASAGEVTASRAGERAYLKCYSCHSLEPGQTALEGPTLYGIVGKPVAADPGFDYSPALRGFAAGNPVWTHELLDRFIADPEALVPGTTMTFTGMSDPKEREALVNHLRRSKPGPEHKAGPG